MKKYLRKVFVLLLTLTFVVLTFSAHTAVSAYSNVFTKNSTYVLKYRSYVDETYCKYIFRGQTALTAEEVYQVVMPATYAQAKEIANLWNSGKTLEILEVCAFEDPKCIYNPSYCSSIGIQSFSKVTGYKIHSSWETFKYNNGLYTMY